jgi:cellulose synthase/poly-beta-1,6-N-acetylglucosamine synthase-like glycosyltransferase
MSGTEWVFWSCIAAVLYHYAGYPVLLYVVSIFVQAGRDFRFLLSRRTRRPRAAGDLPTVAILFAAFNEQEVIAEKLRNSASLGYPSEKLEVLLGLDAPTDATAGRARSAAMPNMHIFEFPVRRGKFEVLCDLVQRTSADILVFTDANTILDSECISNLVRHFTDRRVGAVSGEEVRFGAEGCSGELLYWRYESAIKVLESRLNCVMGSNGSINAIRRELFKPKAAYLMEDLQIALAIRFGGYRVVYDPEAIATEDTVASVKGQFERRVRIAAGVYQAWFQNPGYLNPQKGLPAFAFFSHRVLRMMAPFLLLTALAANFMLASQPLYAASLASQLLFYSMAAIGYRQRLGGKTNRLFAMPLQFCLMSAAYIFGLARYLGGRQAHTWKVTPREGFAAEPSPLREPFLRSGMEKVANPDMAPASAGNTRAA